MNFWEMLSKIFSKLLLQLNFKNNCGIVKTDLQTIDTEGMMTCCVMSVAINLLSLTPGMKQQNVAKFLYLLFDCSTAA